MEVVIGASNTWGLIMVVMMLGYGVVDIPRALWRRCQPKLTLRRMQYHVATIHNELVEAQTQVWGVDGRLVGARGGGWGLG